MKAIIIIILICFTGCFYSSEKTDIRAGSPVRIDDLPGECPYLTKDNSGNSVLSWVRMLNDTTTAFCYAINNDEHFFNAPVVIPNTGNIQPHGENLPKIIFKPSGEIIALWGTRSTNLKNKYSGMVYYSQSYDNGKSWTDARSLVTDTAGFDQRYYDVALLPGGEAGIIWLDNRKTSSREGSALYFASTEGKKGFNSGKMISENCCPCCRTDLYVDTHGNIHTLYRGIIHDSIRDMVHMVSTDSGKTFSEPKRINDDNWVINACPHTGPAMTENSSGLHFAWYTGGSNKGCYYTSSTDNGKSFKSPGNVSQLGSHPQLISLPGDNLLITWDESHRMNDKVCRRIGVEIRNPDGSGERRKYITGDNVLASYPVVSATGKYSAIVAYSEKQGENNFVTYQVVKLD